MKEALESQGASVKVFTDRTDFYKLPKKHVRRYSGVQKNYRNIIEDETQDKWKVIMHDDISVPTGLVEKINHILSYAPDGLVSFYIPVNSTYQKFLATGKHVLKTYNNWWVPCHAITNDLAKYMAEWSNERVNPVGYLAEDGLIRSFTSHTNTPVYVIAPSLIQHDGFDQSTFKNPARAGRYFRFSQSYEPDFDAFSVNWEAEFADPYPENSKRTTTFGLDGNLPSDTRFD
jgi:hypothetical protein